MDATFDAQGVLTEYLRAAMRRAEYEKLEDGTLFAKIPGLPGLWANADSADACRRELQSTLEDWLLVGLKLGHPIPPLDGIDLNSVPAA